MLVRVVQELACQVIIKTVAAVERPERFEPERILPTLDGRSQQLDGLRITPLRQDSPCAAGVPEVRVAKLLDQLARRVSLHIEAEGAGLIARPVEGVDPAVAAVPIGV